MNEGSPTINNNEALNRKTYEDFRKEIIGFKDLPESVFSEARDNIGKLDPQEAKNLIAHGIIKRIENDSYILTQDQIIELTHLWEKEILGFTKKRVMYDTAGNVLSD